MFIMFAPLSGGVYYGWSLILIKFILYNNGSQIQALPGYFIL